MAFSLAGKWVLITGASSGFGAAAAAAFGALRCNLLLGARRLDRLEVAAAAALQAGAPQALVHPLDVTKTASVEEFVQWVRTQTSAVDVLINNAGGAHGMEPVASAHDEDWEAMLQTNVLGLLRATRAVLPLIPWDTGSSILNIGSVAGRTAYEGGAAYCAAKAGELKITQALRLELNGTGIRIGSIDPGLARTEFGEVRFKGDQARAEKVYEGINPLVAEDVAEALVWVATRPPHVNIDEMVIKPVDQAATFKVFRRTP
jgi:3-hydroxy acid dehydrogenase/malonic semialdehyde reductase